MLKQSYPVFVLLAVVIGGVIYSFKSGHSIFAKKPGMSDSRCYGINVPETVPYHQSDLFCSCVRTAGHTSKAELYAYCAAKLDKKELVSVKP